MTNHVARPGLIVALAALLAGPALAMENGTVIGTTEEAIRAALTAEGYDVRKFEAEDGEVEVYAVKDGQRFEIYVDGASGSVTRIKQDD